MSQTFSHDRSRRQLIIAAALYLPQSALVWAAPQTDAHATDPIRFGILPVGGAEFSSDAWLPVLTDLSRRLGRPISKLSVTSYREMEQALERNEVDLAFLSGKLALEAVTNHAMQVIAQIHTGNGLSGYRATLLALQDGPVHDLEAVLTQPSRWRLARGEKLSVSGFIVPRLELFLPRGIDIETSFRGQIVGTHLRTALAVANGEADLATSNSADFERFALQFPAEAKRLKVLWQSTLIPNGVIVVRLPCCAALRQQLQDFLTGYGRANGSRSNNEPAILKNLLDRGAGFLPADNSALIPVAEFIRHMNLDQARSAQWINPAAQQTRLDRIERDFATQMQVLRGQ
ncbi:MAG: phosphate/phosphite/phosphonate ABC transporter substrate-binding protein [Burkholderiaceae bacterium]|nr:phosphate/phosphite/phosphonate ABC transporter substrate-binding protein [Burkholderiaceae bacterium]